MPKIGVIGTIDGWSSEKLADTVEEKTGFRLLIDLEKVCVNLETEKIFYKNIDISKLDALIIKKVGARYSSALLDRLEMLRFLNEKGMKIFSKPLNIMRVLDRLSCTVTLKNGDIPMPETIITEDIECAIDAVGELKEAVFKPLYSSKARGMKIIKHTDDDVLNQIQVFKESNSIMYIQKKIDIGDKDLGLIFLGGDYITTYSRCGDGSSWNTTTRSGGKYKPYTPSNEMIELAHKAQALFGLDFTCVDIALTSQGPIVFEVSAFGGFRGIQTACNMDAARLYTEYVLKHIQ